MIVIISLDTLLSLTRFVKLAKEKLKIVFTNGTLLSAEIRGPEDPKECA
jgi:hypothetical protein